MGLILQQLGCCFMGLTLTWTVQDHSWDPLWHALAGDRSPLERAELVTAWEPRLNVKAARGDAHEAYRRQLARNALGLERRPLVLPKADYMGPPPEAWIAARFRSDDRIALLALGIGERGLAPEPDLLRMRKGFELFLEREGSFHADAEVLAEALHQKAQATWSAFCLEGILRRLGKGERALAVINQQLEAVGPSAGSERTALLGRRAIIHGGMGNPAGTMGDLGSLLALGATDGYQILGLTALQEGRWSTARGHFGVLLDRSRVSASPPPPWALRGYGVSLLRRGTSRGAH